MFTCRRSGLRRRSRTPSRRSPRGATPPADSAFDISRCMRSARRCGSTTSSSPSCTALAFESAAAVPKRSRSNAAAARTAWRCHGSRLTPRPLATESHQRITPCRVRLDDGGSVGVWEVVARQPDAGPRLAGAATLRAPIVEARAALAAVRRTVIAAAAFAVAPIETGAPTLAVPQRGRSARIGVTREGRRQPPPDRRDPRAGDRGRAVGGGGRWGRPGPARSGQPCRGGGGGACENSHASSRHKFAFRIPFRGSRANCRQLARCRAKGVLRIDLPGRDRNRTPRLRAADCARRHARACDSPSMPAPDRGRCRTRTSDADTDDGRR